MDPENQLLSQQGFYDVFLSTSDEETRNPSLPSSLLKKAGGKDTEESFPSRLYSSLREAGISVITDDISIKSSKISIIIFSEHYVSSKRCLKQLTKILKFHKSCDQVVIPIFYGVNQSDVRNQKSSFGLAFLGFIQRISATEDEVLKWRRALDEASDIDWFVEANLEPNNDESVAIQSVVEQVRDILDVKAVGSQVEEVNRMLKKRKSRGVVFIGIWGMAGIGKTTVVRLIFEKIQHEFKGKCFFSDVRNKWKDPKSVISKARSMRINNHNKKLLVVLDDVNHVEQLHGFCGSRKWFGEGSRIIITTRDLHLLNAFQVDDVHTMKLLSHHESLELFNRKAFGQASVEEEFIQLSESIVAYAEGLPLALKVLGSRLHGRSRRQWESEFMKLRTNLPQQIYGTLKLSFDSLEGNVKEIFLNMVLFYIGEDVDDVIRKLDGRGCDSSIAIRVLVDRSFLTIDKDNKLRMHNLLQLMGRQITHETSQNVPQNQGYKYEVFLSFRGEDTRTTFTSHLYSALCNAPIIVFKDDVELPIGNYIKMELLEAIGSSKLSVIIFSKEYTGSKWCLEELSMIMELRKSSDQVILPVFYDVDASEIRHQTSSFGEAFTALIQRISPAEDQVSKWRSTLTEAGGIAGIVVLSSMDESEKVEEVVRTVCDVLDKKDLFVDDHPVGVDDRVQEVITMLQNHQSDEDVVMVGDRIPEEYGERV